MMFSTASPPIRNRFGECETLERLLRDARDGQSGVLVIRGEAGVGKSALLGYAGERAIEFRVAHVCGVESEMELPFAGLHQLCAPILDRVDSLPAPQQRALRVALGLASGDPPDRFLVGLGALTLLADVAEEQPLLCLVDDSQWLDGATRQVLGFVARRLLAEPVAMLFGIREPTADRELAGLPDLMLGGLADEDSYALLETVIPGRIDERVRDRIVAETRGNPLALLELPRGLSATHLAGGFGLPDTHSLAGRIEESFVRRFGELPEDTRLLLLVAAAELAGDAALMWRAAVMLGVPETALAPAIRTGPARGRRAGSVPASARALGDIPVGAGGGSPRGPLGAGGCARSRGRSGPCGVASSRIRRGPRRACRLGARALGRQGAGARRSGGRGRVPAAGSRADTGRRAARGPRACRCPGERRRRGVRRRPGAGGDG